MKQLLILCAALLLILSACGQAPAEPDPTTIPTTIEASQAPAQPEDVSFEAFYEEFVIAVRNQDMQFIDGILDDGVMSSFGGEPTKAFFHEHWEIEETHNGRELWAVLEETIALGGVHYEAGEYFPDQHQGECFVAPYILEEFRKTGLDAFEHLAVIEADVPVYEEESAASKVTGTLDYGYVAFHSDFWGIGPEEFVSVTALSGTAGYVQWKHLRSPIDYRLCFEKKDSGWKLLWLIAGD